jgi:3-methyl-2-oxobutanoate hydroxymethyltransferase
MMNILNFKSFKNKQEKISMISCYEFWSAKILEESDIDCLLVGDSVAMVVYGHNSTVHADMEMMIRHTQAVRRGAPSKFVVADMPFLTFRKGSRCALECAGELLQAGANAVKIEGVCGHEDVIRYLVESGIPVMGHLGLTPQSIEQLGGFRVQGKDDFGREKILRQAEKLQEAGCFSLILECIPSDLAWLVTQKVTIPTIGIGAGNLVDGQVLVFQDLMGVDKSFYPKFLKKYSDGHEQCFSSIQQFVQEVKGGVFPSRQESFQ